MLPNTIFVATVAVFAMVIPTIQARQKASIWCQFYYSEDCAPEGNANPWTHFDCSNYGIIGSGGRWIACRDDNAKATSQCVVERFEQKSDSRATDVLPIPLYPQNKGIFNPGGRASQCVDLGAHGPWFRLYDA